MIIEQIRRIAQPGTVIPKPDAKADFIVKGWGRRREENALIYFVPNHENPRSPSEKGITESEWEQAYQQITKNEEFSRTWFEQNMDACNKEGGCNFTTIGGIFELLGRAYYERSVYKKYTEQMIVKAWKAATYGIRVGKPNAREYFSKDWDQIKVGINGEFHTFNLSPTFWTTCPEFRGGPIPSWLESQGLIPWPKGNPPEFELIPLGNNKFRLLRQRQ